MLIYCIVHLMVCKISYEVELVIKIYRFIDTFYKGLIKLLIIRDGNILLGQVGVLKHVVPI